jgi:hypothetical protein
MITPSPPQDFTAYLLAELRCASLRARILQADIDAIGIALKGGLISPDQALELLADVDALRVVATPPTARQQHEPRRS